MHCYCIFNPIQALSCVFGGKNKTIRQCNIYYYIKKTKHHAIKCGFA
jgi:hypothetical protein